MIAGIVAGGRPITPDVASDPHWADVASLVSFDQADGSTTITCKKGVTYITSGDVVVRGASARFGVGGGRFSGVGGSNFWRASSPLNGFMPPVFTLEAWVRFDDFAKGYVPFSLDASYTTLVPYVSAARISLDTQAGTISGVTGVAPGAWIHIAIVRVDGFINLYVNGVNQGAKAHTNNLYESRLTLGAAPSDYVTRNLKGDIDEFRYTKNVARYTATFAPPTGPFPSS